MPIPQNITRQHVVQAMRQIDVKGVPPVNKSTKYDLWSGKRKYPPKYTISQANHFAGNKELLVSDFYGGNEANNFLIARDFKIIDKRGNLIKPEPVSEDEESSFPEGKIKYRKHRQYERDPGIARKAKSKRLQDKKYLECDACGFCFQKIYGARGIGFIEAHHNVAISQLGARQRTKLSDISLVCSNCHRMLHRATPWLSVDELKKKIVHIKVNE
ncbi:MAG: HNH endonuclease [Nitrospirales bacterium]